MTQVTARTRSFSGALGAGAAVLGSLSPWARFPGFPGKMTLAGYPGGARLFCLVLCAAALLLLFRLPGRRRAGLAAAAGVTVIAGVNVVAIAGEGGGLDTVAWGAWTTAAGGLLLLVAFAGAGEDATPTPAVMPVPANPMIERVMLVSAVAATLGLVVWALDIEESSRFISFLGFVIAAATVLHRLGVLAWLHVVSQRHRFTWLAAAGAAALVFPFTQAGDAYWLRVFVSIGVFAAAAIGLNIVVGLAGLLDLGYVAFFGVGAYVGALFADAGITTVHVHLPFMAVVVIGALVAGVTGVAIGAPTLRLRGDYLAIVTLGFGEIFRITANNWDGLTRGPNGISGIPDLEVLGFNFGESHVLFGATLPGFANYYYVELLLLAVAALAFSRLNDSRIGRAWVAIREDEVAAAAMGVDTVRLKLLAFAIGASMAGAAGTINAHTATQVSPDSYTFLESILLVAAVVLGGMGTIPGALLGSTALFVIPEKLRAFQDKRLLLFGAALVIMMRFRPEGIMSSRRRQRELHDEMPTARQGATGPAPGTAAEAST